MGGAAHLEKCFEIGFTASESFMKKYARVKSIASHRLAPNPKFEEVFELALDLFLEKNDPSERQERRDERKRKATTQKSVAGEPAVPKAKRRHNDPMHRARHVPARIRDQVFLRDKGQCTYTSPGGRRCASSYVLQVDHIKPVARGGASTPDNLRLLCAYHNRLEAERLMGPPGGG